MTRPMMFLSFNRGNKENGYYTLRPGQAIQKLVEGPYLCDCGFLPVKATG